VKLRSLTVMLLMIAAGLLAAQESGETDEEDLFGTQEEAAAQSEDPSLVLLSGNGVEIGGRFRLEATASWNYDGLEGPFGAKLVGDPLALDLGAVLFLDARPTATFRVFGKTDISYPFTDQDGTRTFDEVFQVKELFSDFQLGDAAFFRAGKQTISWGVGYYFSPADLLNIAEIDPEDPEAELEGPLALKIHVPTGAHNLYLYTVFEDAGGVDEVALAPKAEVLIGDVEIGLGAFYRRGNAPAAMLTLTTTLFDFSLFAEGLLSYGSDRTFVVEDPAAPLGVSTRTYEDVLYPSATAGFRYRWSDDLAHFDVSLVAQYLYNGEGYADADLLKREASGVAALVASGALSAADLRGTGRHYAALNASWTDMFASDFSLGCLWLGNLADGSGMLIPSARWDLSDQLWVTVKASFQYGALGAEYSRAGDAMILSVSASLGGGRF